MPNRSKAVGVGPITVRWRKGNFDVETWKVVLFTWNDRWLATWTSKMVLERGTKRPKWKENIEKDAMEKHAMGTITWSNSKIAARITTLSCRPRHFLAPLPTTNENATWISRTGRRMDRLSFDAKHRLVWSEKAQCIVIALKRMLTN